VVNLGFASQMFVQIVVCKEFWQEAVDQLFIVWMLSDFFGGVVLGWSF